MHLSRRAFMASSVLGVGGVAALLSLSAGKSFYGLSRLADGSIMASKRDGAAFSVERGLRSQFMKVDRAAPLRWDDHWVSVDA